MSETGDGEAAPGRCATDEPDRSGYLLCRYDLGALESLVNLRRRDPTLLQTVPSVIQENLT